MFCSLCNYTQSKVSNEPKGTSQDVSHWVRPPGTVQPSPELGGRSTLRERALLGCAGWDLQTPRTNTVFLPSLLEMSGVGSPSANFHRATSVRQ